MFSNTRKESTQRITLTEVVEKLIRIERRETHSMDASEVKADMLSLSKAGTMQLRTIARVIHVKYYSKLKRDKLILAIIARKEELRGKQQLKLFE